MLWIIEYIKMMTCHHDFVYDEGKLEKTASDGSTQSGLRFSMTCKKCGYHKSGWKFM